MAVTDLRCIGQSGATATCGIRTFGNTSEPFYPATASDDIAHQMRSVEVFFSINTVSFVAGRFVFLARDGTTSTHLLSLRVATVGGAMICQFRDANNVGLQIQTVPIPFASNPNVWWHAVLMSSGTTWFLFVGRVGRTVTGASSTADAMPYQFSGTAGVTNGIDRLMGLRRQSTVATNFGIGAQVGTSGTFSSPWQGNVAEFRAWDANRSILPGVVGGYEDLRDQFIDSATFPTLIHCWRLNEASGTPVSAFDNTGYRVAHFQTQVLNAGFASSPMPAQSGPVDVVATARTNDAVASENAAHITKNSGLFVTTAGPNSIASQNTPTIRRATVVQATGAGVNATASQNTPSAVRRVGLASTGSGPNATASENTPTVVVNNGFFATDSANDAIASDNTPTLLRVVDLSATSSANDAIASQGSVQLNRVHFFSATGAGNDAFGSEPPTISIDIAGARVFTAASPDNNAIASEGTVTLLRSHFLAATGVTNNALTDQGLPSDFLAEVAALSPTLYWKLDALPAVDSSGNGVTGTLSGGPATVVSGATPATATTGFAIRSDSGAAVITASNTSVGSPHPTTNEFAVAFTMHMNLSIGAKGWVRKRRDIINLMWQVRTLAGTQIVFERRQVTGVVETLTTPTAFLPDVPHFVVATWTPGEMALYVDGNLMASSTTITATDTATTLPLQLFQTSIGGANGGTLDDFIVLDRALSAAEVTSLYAEWASGPGVPINVLRDFSATASANDAIASQNNPTATTASDRIFDGTNPANDAIASQNTPTLSTNGGLTTTNAERALGTETLVQSNVTRAFSATSAANNAVASQNTPSLNGSGQRTFSMTAGGEAISSQNTPTLARSVTPAATGAGNNATASQNTPTLLRNRGFETAAQADQNKAIGSEFAQLAAPAEFAATGAGNNAVASQGPQVTDTFASTLALNFPPTFWWQLDSITGSNDSGTAGTGAGSPIGASLGAGGLISQQQTSALFDATGDRVESNNTTSWQTTSPTHSYTLGAWFEIDSFSGAGDQFVCSKQAFASIRVLDDGSVVFSRTNELAQIKEATSSPGAVQAGGRHFVVAVFERVSGQGQKLYIDGSLVAQNTDITTQNNPLFRRFEAGRDTDTSGENFDGRIQHVFLINQVALSQAQIGTLVAAANSGASGGPSINVDRGFAPPPDEATGDETASITGSTLEVEILERETISATVLTLEEYMSVLDIWNVALTRLGIEPVTSAPTSDGSPQGVILATNWPLFKEAFLRDASWDGAKKTAALTTFKDSDGVTPVVPTARWNFAYERPSDHVRSLRLNGRENRPGDKDVAGSLGLWEEEVATNDVGTRKRCLFTDEASANLEYVFLVPDSDITLMPADMRWAMALALAAHVATSFGKTTTEASMLELDAEKAKRNALRTDSATGTKPTLIDYTIANAFW